MSDLKLKCAHCCKIFCSVEIVAHGDIDFCLWFSTLPQMHSTTYLLWILCNCALTLQKDKQMNASSFSLTSPKITLLISVSDLTVSIQTVAQIWTIACRGGINIYELIGNKYLSSSSMVFVFWYIKFSYFTYKDIGSAIITHLWPYMYRRWNRRLGGIIYIYTMFLINSFLIISFWYLVT